MSSTCPCCNQLIPYGHGCNSHSSALEVMGIHAESELKQKQLELLEYAEKALQADWESTDKSYRMVERVFKYLKQRIGDA